MRPRKCEFDGAIGTLPGAAEIKRKVHGSLTDVVLYHACRLGAESHSRSPPELFHIPASDVVANTGEGTNKIFNHSVGVRVVYVPPVQLSVGHDINAG